MPLRLAAVALGVAMMAGCRADAGSTAESRLGTFGSVPEAITLLDHRGASWTLPAADGRVRIVFFGYTMCADACPLAMSRIAQASRLLGEDARRLDAVFVSVDRERDTQPVLAEYVKAFSFPLTGLTGSQQAIDAMAAPFGARYEIHKSDSAAGYMVSHTTTLFLVDGHRRIRARFASTTTPADIAAAVKQLLQERS